MKPCRQLGDDVRLAVFADPHANLPALEAVLEAIACLGADHVVCLGDLVGYNAQPSECITRIRAVADVVVAGNHDMDCVRGETTQGTTSAARSVQRWTREQLSALEMDYLRNLPRRLDDPSGFTAVHGCFLNTTYCTGYVTSTMLEANLEKIAARAEGPSIGLCGHTHIPLCGWLETGGVATEAHLDRTVRWPPGARAVLLNPGSVGQPRDGDPRASFALLDLEARSIELRRVGYDIEAAVGALLDAGLPPELGDRLKEGR